MMAANASAALRASTAAEYVEQPPHQPRVVGLSQDVVVVVHEKSAVS